MPGLRRLREVENGVADEWRGRDVAATVDLVEGDTAAGKELVGGQDVGAVGVAAEGETGGCSRHICFPTPTWRRRRTSFGLRRSKSS